MDWQWKHFALVALGGGAGSALRAYLSQLLRHGFPWGTFLVNVIGCFLIGLLMSELEDDQMDMRLLLVSGFCGGFTTFSAFGSETFTLFREEQMGIGLGYVALTLFSCLAAVALGHLITRA